MPNIDHKGNIFDEFVESNSLKFSIKKVFDPKVRVFLSEKIIAIVSRIESISRLIFFQNAPIL